MQYAFPYEDDNCTCLGSNILFNKKEQIFMNHLEHIWTTQFFPKK